MALTRICNAGCIKRPANNHNLCTRDYIYITISMAVELIALQGFKLNAILMVIKPSTKSELNL